MKYKIIEVADRNNLNKFDYIVQITTGGETKFLKKDFKMWEPDLPCNKPDKLETYLFYELSYDYSTFSTIEEAEKALKEFAKDNPLLRSNKRVVKEGEI